MSRIANMFAKCAAEKRSAFIPFIMAGDPSIPACEALLDALPAAGADIIELGIPFSDPMADGPTIQAAGLRALASGTTTRKVLDIAKRFRAKNAEIPLILMGYYNPIYVFGADAFADAAKEAGVDGLIIVDLPPEEENEIVPQLKARGIALVRLIAPTSLNNRLDSLLRTAEGYIYYISVAGVTGAKSADATELAKQVEHIRSHTSLPISVGFGVKSREQVASISAYANGVVVGSAIVAKIEQYADTDTTSLVREVTHFIRGLSGK